MARRKNELNKREVKEIREESFVTSVSFKDAFKLFIEDCEVKNLRSHTIRYYTNELRAFYKTLREYQLTTDITEFSKSDLKEYIKIQKDASHKITSINTRLRAIRAFFNFLVREGYIEKEYNPVANLKLLRDREKVVQTYTNSEIKELFKVPNQSTFTGMRDLTIMMLFLETGARANELINIKVSDIDFSNNRILLTNTKGYKQRFVPIQKNMQKQLQKYLNLRGQLHHDYLWINIDNEPLAKHTLMINVSNYGKEIGIRATCHKFRHTFGRIAAENGASIFEIQAILGHSSLEMVKHYVNLFSNDVIKKHESFSPIEKLKGGNSK